MFVFFSTNSPFSPRNNNVGITLTILPLPKKKKKKERKKEESALICVIKYHQQRQHLISPQWGAADAEIKVPSGENIQLKRAPLKAWDR